MHRDSTNEINAQFVSHTMHNVPNLLPAPLHATDYSGVPVASRKSYALNLPAVYWANIHSVLIII